MALSKINGPTTKIIWSKLDKEHGIYRSRFRTTHHPVH
jgi:hypothetical protein